MNPPRDSWERLVTAAKEARGSTFAEVPAGFDARVLAAWRRAETREDPAYWLLLMRRALLVSCVVMVITMAAFYQDLQFEQRQDWSVADALLTLSLEHE